MQVKVYFSEMVPFFVFLSQAIELIYRVSLEIGKMK